MKRSRLVVLVKAGDWRTAQKIDANAKLLKSYPTWKHQDAIGDRIARAEAHVAAFNAAEGEGTPMMINSDFACMVTLGEAFSARIPIGFRPIGPGSPPLHGWLKAVVATSGGASFGGIQCQPPHTRVRHLL